MDHPDRSHGPTLTVRFFAGATIILLASLGSGCTDGYVRGEEDGQVQAPDVGADVTVRDLGVDVASEGDTAEDTTVREDGEARDTDDGDDDDGGGNNTCVAEGDGVVQADEVPLRPGLTSLFRVANDVQVDTAGSSSGDGQRWDYSGSYEGDETEVLELQPIQGQWFAADFPEADYAMKLVGDRDELGVFRKTDDALLMLGVVSPDDDGFGETNLEYEPPVKVLDFPIEEGKSWITETTVSGTHETWSPVTPITYEETYRNQVDAAGTLEVPYGDFDVLRVRTVLDRQVGFTSDTVRTFAFVAECFGTVATIRSDGGEEETEFQEAAEIRRLDK